MALETRTQHTLVDPTTQPMVSSFAGAPRLKDLKGKRMGLLDDSKPNAGELLQALADLLKEDYGVADTVYHRKATASRPADPEAIAQIGRECDFAIVAVGD